MLKSETNINYIDDKPAKQSKRYGKGKDKFNACINKINAYIQRFSINNHTLIIEIEADDDRDVLPE